MTDTVITATISLAAWCTLSLLVPPWAYFLIAGLVNAVFVVTDYADLPWSAVFAAVAAGNLWLAWWFWKRRRRNHATALAGAKSRARRAALVRAMRRAARPRPVLRPVPGGAR